MCEASVEVETWTNTEREAFAFGVFGRTTHVLVADIEMDVLLILFCCKSRTIARCPFCFWSRFLLCVCVRASVCVSTKCHISNGIDSADEENILKCIKLMTYWHWVWLRTQRRCDGCGGDVDEYTYNRANGRRLSVQVHNEYLLFPRHWIVNKCNCVFAMNGTSHDSGTVLSTRRWSTTIGYRCYSRLERAYQERCALFSYILRLYWFAAILLAWNCVFSSPICYCCGCLKAIHFP